VASKPISLPVLSPTNPLHIGSQVSRGEHSTVADYSGAAATSYNPTMAEDGGKKEEQFDFTSEGEEVGYISSEQAKLLAIKFAREDSRFYTPARSGTSSVWSWIRLVWEVIDCEEGEDYYDLKISFRPSGRFLGRPGIEQFIIDKLGKLEVRQVLDEPTDLGTCPRCLSPDVRPRFQRHSINKWRCRACNTVFPRPKLTAE